MSLENQIVDKALNSWEQVIRLHFEIGSYMATDLKSGSKSGQKLEKVPESSQNGKK